MLHINATVSLIENSTAGRAPKVFKNQTVEITHEGDEEQRSADGIISVGRIPHFVLWHGGRADQFTHITDVEITGADGSILLEGALCLNVDRPRDVDKGVR